MDLAPRRRPGPRSAPNGRRATARSVVRHLQLDRRVAPLVRQVAPPRPAARPAMPAEALLDDAWDITSVIAADGTRRFVSPASVRLLGYTPAEMIGASVYELYHPDHLEPARRFFASLAARPGATGRLEVRVRHRDGTYRWLEMVATNRLDHPVVGGIVVHSRDVTARKEAEAALHASEARFYDAFGYAAIGMALVTLDGYLLVANPALCDLLGYAPDELAGLSIRSLTHPEDLESNFLLLSRLISGEIRSYQIEKRYLRRDGGIVWGLLSVSLARDPIGNPCYLVAQIQDVTEQKRVTEELAHRAYHDPLTDLPNRVAFNEHLERLLTGPGGLDRSVAVLLLDLNGFKLVNDSLGHECGDVVLIEAARRITACLQPIAPEAMLARLGGDEFAVLLDGADRLDAGLVAGRVAEALRLPYDLGDREVFVGASIGIALGQGGARSSDLLRQADMAMYRAKAQPRLDFQVFDAAMDNEVSRRLELETALRRAVERGAFRLHYQPIVDLKSGQVVAFEALARWSDGERLPVRPGEFVPLAEELGLIVPLGRWVLQEACRQGRRWLERFGSTAPNVSVNLSIRQFEHPSLIDDLRQILRESGLPAAKLTLELTESVFAGDVAIHAHRLGDLTALGVRVAIDDFGAGYSSLGYLRRLPVQSLKLDHSFVAELGEAPQAVAIAKAVRSLAHALNMSVTAEGVETAHQAAILRALGYDYGQGFYFARPLPADAADLRIPEPATALAVAS